MNPVHPTDPDTSVECPNCGTSINVESILRGKLSLQYEQQYREKQEGLQKAFEQREHELEKQKQENARAKRLLAEQIEEGVSSGLTKERKKLETELQQKIGEEHATRIESMEKELNRKNETLKEFHKAQSEIERLKRENEEQQAKLQVENEKKLSERLREERGKIEKAEQDKVELKIKEKDQQLEKLNEQLREAQRQASQGSVQLQGEVQELALEEWLQAEFPLDTIEEVRKGQRGADCLQTVHTHERQNCGTIYYESKRTKDFQPSWIAKFRDDMRDRNADIGVLVTAAMPPDLERMGLLGGVWVCNFEEFKALSLVLRDSIIRHSQAVNAQENRGDKMSLLYDYLTSSEFRLQIEGIVEGFTQMQSDLESEKRSMQMIWKKREKQISRVLTNTNQFYGSVRGIAGNAIPQVSLLELPTEDLE